MKIFYLITKSEAGGAQTHIYQLSKYFIEKGNEVAIMSYPGGWLEDEIAELRGIFYHNEYLSNNLNPIRIFKAMKKIRETIKDFKPDLIACHSTVAGFLGRLTIRNKIPTIFTAHGWGFTEGTSFLRRKLIPSAEKIAAHYCDKIICVSEYDRRLALRYKIAPVEKLITIRNGIEILPRKNAELNAEKRAKINIVFVGRLGRQKDPLLLIRGFNKLSSQLKDKTQISIIGEGPKRKKLEKFIKKNKLEEKIKLLGGISREKVFEILRESDIFVLTSNWEGFPYTIIEAMSFGLAIIASEVGGIKEAINDNCGILVGKGDEEELKDALEKLLKNPSLIKKMGEKAKERVEKEFSLEKMLKNTAKIYSQLQPQKEPISKRSNF